MSISAVKLFKRLFHVSLFTFFVLSSCNFFVGKVYASTTYAGFDELPEHATLVLRDGTSFEANRFNSISGHGDMPMSEDYYIATIRPCYRSVNADGTVIYKEGQSCISLTDHGNWKTHQVVHLWNNKKNDILFQPRSTKLIYLQYNLYDVGTCYGPWNRFEVADNSRTTNKLQGSHRGGWWIPGDKAWQNFQFEVHHMEGKTYWVTMRSVAAPEKLIGLKDMSSTANKTEVWQKEGGEVPFWTITFD